MGINSTSVSYGYGQFGSAFTDDTTLPIIAPQGLVIVAIQFLADASLAQLVAETKSIPAYGTTHAQQGPEFVGSAVAAHNLGDCIIAGASKGGTTTTVTHTANTAGFNSSSAIKPGMQVVSLTDADFPRDGILGKPVIIEEILSQAINTDDTSMPRPNIVKLIDDGTNSQMIIELESDIETPDIKQVYTEHNNIVSLQIINKKIPTVIEVQGKNGVKGRFTHTSAIAAQDREFLSVTNDNFDSPAECKEFAARLFQANLKVQYQYSLEVTEGIYLAENEVVRIQTNQPQFTGDYRVIGKTLAFTPGQLRIGININRKPPTLAEYIANRDN